MENEELLSSKQIIYGVFETKQAVPLDDLTAIEDVLYTIKEFQKKIDFYEDLKVKRINPLDEQVKILKERNDLMKKVITETLKLFKEKSLNFPGVGKVITKKGKSKWTIKDEETLKNLLKKEGEFENLTETETKIKKSELNKLLDAWDKVGKLPDCIEREDGEDGVSITFEKGDIPIPRKEPIDPDNEESASSERINSPEKYDELEF